MLKVENIVKSYEGQLLLSGVSFTVGTGETICLLGPSGSGKSTLLRIISGLEPPESGRIFWNDMDLASTPPHLRDFGLVFQDYALFPHLNVFDNVAFGLRMQKKVLRRRRSPWPEHHRSCREHDGARRQGGLAPLNVSSNASDENEIRIRLMEVLDLVNLNGFEQRKVTELSGGEQQRVALARALAPYPHLLMFDEPLGALDRALKEELLNELRAILHRTDIPAIYVTHDQEEAFAIADRILILHEGRIICEGSPEDITKNPCSAWIAKFLGLGNVIDGVVTDGSKVKTDFGTFIASCSTNHQEGKTVYLLIRPLEAPKEVNAIKGQVADVLFQKDGYKVTLENGLYFYLKDAPKVGDKISIHIVVECLS